MGGSTLGWVAVTVWILGGLGGYYYLYRNAHPHPGWLLVSLVLGPLSMLVFTDRVERSPLTLVHRAPAAPGESTVLVGWDDSPESRHALELAQSMVGDRRCCLVLCQVVDYDSADEPGGRAVAAAADRLERVAADVPGLQPAVEVVAGRPVQALAEAAERLDVDMIVVGTRGSGLSRTLLGSVAEGLLTATHRPVVVARPPQAASDTRSTTAPTSSPR